MKFNSINTRQVLAGFGTILILGCVINANEFVIVYDHNSGEGESVQLNVQSCTSMPRGWNQRVSSLLLMSRGCIELHESRICRDADPMMISNPAESSQLFDLNGEYEFNDRAMALKPCSFDTRSVAAAMPLEGDDSREEFTVTLYEFVERKGYRANVRVQDCTSVPLRLNKNIASVDPRGNCVRLYSGLQCTGDSVQIQPNDPGSSNLHFWNFLDQTSSVGVCQDFQLLGLSLNNNLRRRHNAPALHLNENLNQDAQAAAEALANQADVPTQTSFHSGVLIYSVNYQPLFHSRTNLVREASSAWYQQQITFDSRNPKPSAFTQLVWKSSTEFGIGVATSVNRHRGVVVAKYSPSGNSPGTFQQNVNIPRVSNFNLFSL